MESTSSDSDVGSVVGSAVIDDAVNASANGEAPS
jgi:hypothetical protein